MRTDTRVLSLRLEDDILITGCGEVWKTETRPDTHTNSGVWKTLHTGPADDHIRETTLGRLSKVQSGGCDSDWHTPVWKTVS